MKNRNAHYRKLLPVIFLVTSICAETSRSGENMEPVGLNDENGLVYPYTAPADKESRVLSAVHSIRLGMHVQDVQRLLGVPDEINKTYEPKYRSPKEIGKSFVYVLARKAAKGSMLEKSERLVRIHFNLDDLVTRVTSVGIPEVRELHETQK